MKRVEEIANTCNTPGARCTFGAKVSAAVGVQRFKGVKKPIPPHHLRASPVLRCIWLIFSVLKKGLHRKCTASVKKLDEVVSRCTIFDPFYRTSRYTSTRFTKCNVLGVCVKSSLQEDAQQISKHRKRVHTFHYNTSFLALRRCKKEALRTRMQSSVHAACRPFGSYANVEFVSPLTCCQHSIKRAAKLGMERVLHTSKKRMEIFGASPSGKAAGFDPDIRRFESFRPSNKIMKRKYF